MNKIKFKNNKLNDMLTSDNKNKDKESIVENIVKPSSSLLNFQNHRAKKMHRNNHEEDNLSTSKDDYNDRYRDLTPNLPIQYSEGESDFDFSESLITNRKRKRCRSIFDIYFDTKRKNSKHSTPSSHSEHKRHKEESLSQNSNHKLSKESENNSHLNDKEKKKSISNQSFANKKNHSNSNDTSSRYYYSSDEDKEKIQESLENSKIKNYKSNKKLKTKKSKIINKYENNLFYYYYRRQPPRSCRTENDPLSAKLYYSMYSSEDNISEIEELFADLDNRQNNIEKEENANYTSGNVKNNNNNNYREENTYSSDGKSSIKNKLKDNKLNKNLKYKNSITSLHSISEENIDPKTKLTSNTTTPNKNVKRSKIINNKNFEKEGAEEVEEVEEVEEEEYNKNNKLLHNHNRYSSVSSSLSQRDRDQNRIRVKEDKDNNSSVKKDRYYLGEEKERISKEESFSKQYNQKLKNQKILEQTSNTKSSYSKDSLKIKSLKSSYHQNSDYDNDTNDYLSLNDDDDDENEEEIDDDDDDDEYQDDFDENENENEYDYDYHDLDSDSEYISEINTPSRRRKSLIDSKKLHEGSISNSTSTPTKLKSKKYSTHHRRMTTTTTDDSSFLYDDMDSISEMDNNIEGNDKVHRYKRKSLTKINENVFDIPNEDEDDDQLFDFNLLKTNGGKKKVDTLKKQKSYNNNSSNNSSKNNNNSNSNNNNRHSNNRLYHPSSSSSTTLSNFNKKIISKNDRYDSEVRSRSKDHLDTHNILKSSSTSSNSNDINFMKSSKSRLMTPPNKRSNSKLSTPEKKVRVKMLDLEEKKERHTHHHYSLFGKKLKSKLNSSNSFFDNEFKKSKLKYKSRNEQKEKERKMLSMDKEEEDDDDVEGVEDVEVEEEEEEELYRYPEFLKDKGTIKNNIPKNENKTRNKNRNQRMIKGKDLESESDDIMNETSAYERESIYTPTKPLNCKKIKFIDRERKSHTMNSWNKNPLLIIGSIQNPTLLKRSQPSNSNSNDITNEKSNITNINNGNETSPSNNSSNSNEVDGIKKSQDQTESNSFTEHILLTREVVEQLNSLNVTEDEYDITPTLSKHSNIYIKNELFNLLNDMAANEGSYSKAIDNYTTIYSNPIIDKVELAPSRIIEKNKNDNNEKDLENLKDKEEDFAIHYLCPEYQTQTQNQTLSQTQTQSQSQAQSQIQIQFQNMLPSLSLEDNSSTFSFMDDHDNSQDFDGESKLDINNNPLLKDTKVSSNNTYLPTPMDSSMEELILTTPIKSGTLEKTKPLFSSSASSVEDSLSEDKISQNTLSSESVKENNIPSDTDFSTFDKKNYPYNYPLAETVKNKIYKTLKTVDLLRDELYQLKYNQLKYEEDLIKKNIHPGFEIQQNSLKEELFNKIKQAKRLRDISIETIYKSYQTSIHSINNSYIDNKHKVKYDLNRKIGHNYFKLCKEMRTLKRKRIMDKKNLNLYSVPNKKGILEAATVLATFSTPVFFNKNKNNNTSHHYHNTFNKRGVHTSHSLPSTSSTSTSSSSIPTSYSHIHVHPSQERNPKRINIFQNKKKRIPLNCDGLNSEELDHDLSLLKLLN
jgi:hypothetical protein